MRQWILRKLLGGIEVTQRVISPEITNHFRQHTTSFANDVTHELVRQEIALRQRTEISHKSVAVLGSTFEFERRYRSVFIVAGGDSSDDLSYAKFVDLLIKDFFGIDHITLHQFWVSISIFWRDEGDNVPFPIL